MALLQDGYPLKSKELAKELEKRSQRSGASKKHASIFAKFRAMNKTQAPSRSKKANERK